MGDSVGSSGCSNRPAQGAGQTASKIEALFEAITDQLSRSEALTIAVPSRRTRGENNDGPPNGIVHFPGRTEAESRKFARIMAILQLAHSAVVSGNIFTKRHIFYQNKELFGNQRAVDELVDDIAAALCVNRDDLNIVASSKGLVSGRMRIHCSTGSILDATSGDGGMPVPLINTINRIDLQGAKWILVIEKDAVFRPLSSVQFWDSNLAGPGVIVTAKGYPDLTTRAFLSLVKQQHPSVPMFALTDFDPYGIHIFSCYRFGSKALQHDSTAQTLDIQWLGIRTKHLTNNTSDESALFGSSSESEPSISTNNLAIPLTSKDRRAAQQFLKKLLTLDHSHAINFSLQREIQTMLMIGAKAEIQALDENGCSSVWIEVLLLDALSVK